MPKRAAMTEEVVSAASIAPDAYDEYDEDIVDDLEYDVYNLVACDNHALNVTDGIENSILAAATRATQLLVKRYNWH